MDTTLSIGLMSGTSMDGIDAALVETDGEAHVRSLAFHSVSYPDALRTELRSAMSAALAMDRPAATEAIAAAERAMTLAHADVVKALVERSGADRGRIAVVGFHGQTIAHRPERGWTWQIGDGALLAQLSGLDVVSDFRSEDVASGGQGAPLLPLYHRARLGDALLDRPVAVLNVGGVANVTYLARGRTVAFDTGPGNALVDDLVASSELGRFDAEGALAATGRVRDDVLTAMLDNPFFDQPAPKSLDRHDFTIQPVRGLPVADGAATLTALTAECVRLALMHLPEEPAHWYVTGGGRHNGTLMRMLGERLGAPVSAVEALGWNGDAIEAEGFAYFAVRSLKGLPITYPETTGVARPTSGGVLHRFGRAA